VLLQPRKHFGVNKVAISTLPNFVLRGMEKVVGDYSYKQLIDSGKVLDRYLSCRKTPIEESQKKDVVKRITELVESDPAKFKLPLNPPHPDNELSVKIYDEMKRQRIEKTVRQRVYAWQQVVYDDYKSLLYLFGRSPQEYSAINKIFREIKKRDENFRPKSFFDFGSGVGTGLWAASELWSSSI
jgi:Mitochondrial small ribosomal subunit Rsm22